MYISALLLSLLALCSKVTAVPAPTSSVIEAITQAAYKTAFLVDTQNYNALNEVWTKDIVYDSTDLGEYGHKSTGLEQAIAGARSSGVNARTSALVTNVFVRDLITPKKARVDVYVTFTHWAEGALDDVKKTFRIINRCDDIWVLQDGAWKLQNSKVLNMGYGVEAPYYGKAK